MSAMSVGRFGVAARFKTAKILKIVLSDHPKPANEYHLKTGQ